jgi:oligopeptide/dipeptide ABC transporter ATP-binding protein
LNVLEVENLTVEYPTPGGAVRAVDQVSFSIAANETVTIVGESGCGKTTIARAVLGLQPIAGGTILVNGRTIRGSYAGMAREIGMVWQDPNSSLDPRWTVAKSIAEPAALVGEKARLDQLLNQVGLSPELGERYPHQLSGGQRQRAAIARAIALKPPLVICDEPTAALDLSIQAQILNLLKDLQAETGCALCYISHDLGTVRYLGDRVLVMYMGKIVEQGSSESVFSSPRHHYTSALLRSAPRIDAVGILPEGIQGEISSNPQTTEGCRFAPRCPCAQDRCMKETPEADLSQHHSVACHFPLSLG